MAPLICPNSHDVFFIRNNIFKYMTTIRKSRQKCIAELLKALPVQGCCTKDVGNKIRTDSLGKIVQLALFKLFIKAKH